MTMNLDYDKLKSEVLKLERECCGCLWISYAICDLCYFKTRSLDGAVDFCTAIIAANADAVMAVDLERIANELQA